MITNVVGALSDNMNMFIEYAKNLWFRVKRQQS